VASAPSAAPRAALVSAFGCYVMWGFMPLLFMGQGALGFDALEILAHRALWAVAIAGLLVLLAKQGGQVRAAFASPTTLGWLTLSTLLIGVNWGLYVWATTHHATLEASLGYYINPLLNMVVGLWLFREKIDKWGWVAIGLAAIGVAFQTAALGRPPWISIILAISFASYGVIRKRVPIDAQAGLLVECLLLVPFGLAWVLWLQHTGAGAAFDSPVNTLWALANGPATVLRQERYASNCWKMVLRLPWTGQADAGQFLHVLCGDASRCLLRRPFSLWDLRPDGDSSEIDLVYTVVGPGTRSLAQKRPGETVGVLGPLGRGFSIHPRARKHVFVAGGVGIVPFYFMARRMRERAPGGSLLLLFGGRTASMLYGIEDFAPCEVETRAATEDGSRGMQGRVTDLLAEELQRLDPAATALYACGPEPMLEAVADIARRRAIACQVSMEKRMGCALGACGACVTTVKSGGDWRYSRICIEGPCYDADTLVPGRM